MKNVGKNQVVSTVGLHRNGTMADGVDDSFVAGKNANGGREESVVAEEREVWCHVFSAAGVDNPIRSVDVG